MRRLPQLTKVVLASLILVPILQLLVAPASQAAIVSRGLIARWDAKNPASYPGTGTAWNDLSGNGYTATLQNGLTTSVESFTASVRAPSMHLWGTNSNTTNKYATLPNMSLGALTAFSATFYANFGNVNGTQGWDRVFDIGTGSGANNILVARQGITQNIWFELYGASTSLGGCTVANTIDNNTYNFYAIVIDGTNCTITKNSSKQTPVSYTSLPTNVTRTSNYIGRSNWTADNTFGGSIADLALYSVALTDTEVAQNYAEQTAPQVLSITSTPPNPIIQGVTSYTFTDTSTSQLLPVRTIDSGSTSVCSLTGNTVNFLGAGTCKINSTQPGNANYSAATSISQSFTVNANTSVSVSLSGNATYRQLASLSATVAPLTGRITFYAQGKAIPGCKNVLVSSSPYVCSRKPSQHNSVTITATYDPTANGYSTITTSPTAIRVVPRSGTR